MGAIPIRIISTNKSIKINCYNSIWSVPMTIKWCQSLLNDLQINPAKIKYGLSHYNIIMYCQMNNNPNQLVSWFYNTYFIIYFHHNYTMLNYEVQWGYNRHSNKYSIYTFLPLCGLSNKADFHSPYCNTEIKGNSKKLKYYVK